MTNQENTAPSWPLPDLRPREAIEGSKAAVREQVAAISSTEGITRKLADVVERIQQRQLAAPDGQATRFEIVVPPGTTHPVLAVRNQLVIRASDQQLAQLGSQLSAYVAADRTGRSPVRKTRVFRGKSPRAVADLLADAKNLRDNHNVQANINMVVPLGYVIKGDDYPGLTVSPGPYSAGPPGAPVRVAIIDTGLTAETRTDAWFTNTAGSTDPLNVLAPMDRNDWFAGHGTFTAGIVRQLAPGAEVKVYRFTTTDGLGTDEAAADTLIKAADDAAADGVQRLIINASFGAPAVDGIPPLAMQDAVDYIAAQYPNVLIVASAGNDGVDQPLYPAAYPRPGVKAVGALNSDLTGAAFSNRGSWVDCSTIGVGVVSTFVQGKMPPEDNLGVPDINFPTNSWATWSGTSFTAPQISGAVASLCAANSALLPRVAFDQLIQGRPTLNGFGAVVHLLPGTPV